MGNIIFSNNGTALTAVGLAPLDVTVTVASGFGARFPNPVAPQYALCTIEDVGGNFEIVRLTSRAGDVLTVTRAQEGTTALTFASGSRIENRLTSGQLAALVQSAGDTITGPFAAAGAVVTGGNWNAGEVVNSPIRGQTGVVTNQIAVPSGGGPATAGGSTIYTAANLTQAVVNAIAFPVGTVLSFYGLIGNIPAGFQLCDGTNGTPDLRDKFIVGAGGAYANGAVGGFASTTSGAGGAVTPTIQGTAITEAQLPAHNHRIFAANNSSNSNADGWGNFGARGIPGEDVGPFAYRDLSAQNDQIIEDTGSGQTHTHTADPLPAHTHSVATLPPYVALFWIMKV